MVTWIAIGIVVLAMAVLVATSLGTAGRLRPLWQALTGLQARRDEAARLQETVAGMQAEMADLQDRVALAQQRAAAIKAHRQP